MRSLTFSDRPARRDPAPSRMGYRLQRLMLTPGFRGFVRIGTPIFLVVFLCVAWLGKPDNRAALADFYFGTIDAFQNRPEFMVDAVAVSGADAELERDIRAVLPLELPRSSFDIDLVALQTVVEALGAVDTAVFRVKPGGILQIDVTERQPIAIWRNGDDLFLVDRSGVIIRTVAARGLRPDLPLLTGEGARDAVPEALALTQAAQPLGEALRGFVRKGARRWDIVLDGERRILLPEGNPLPALERVIVMAQSQDLLDRDVILIDMRNEQRPSIRLGAEADRVMRQINASVAGAGK